MRNYFLNLLALGVLTIGQLVSAASCFASGDEGSMLRSFSSQQELNHFLADRALKLFSEINQQPRFRFSNPHEEKMFFV